MAAPCNVKPVELKGLALLRWRQPRPGRWFPAETNPRALAEATVEFIEYTQTCVELAHRLACVGPAALTGAAIAEFPL